MREGDSMKKAELLHLHMLMFHIMMYFEGITHDEIRTGGYNSLDISPFHIHKDKDAHQDALFTLGDEIVTYLHNRKLPAVTVSFDAAPPRVAAE